MTALRDYHGKRVCILTAGHLSTCPRMLKAADALAEAGYRVRVVSSRFMPWAAQADGQVRATRRDAWDWCVLPWGPRYASTPYMGRQVRRRTAQVLAARFGPQAIPYAVVTEAYAPIHRDLVGAAVSRPTDLFYAGTSGALAAAAEASQRTGVPYALDLEDFHTAEQNDSPQASLAHGLAERIERRVLSRAAFLTASSTTIAAAYAGKYGVAPVPIHNTFPLPPAAPCFGFGEGPLRMYWFSQTIGPGRGLEDAVRAASSMSTPAEIHLRGRLSSGYERCLAKLAGETGVRLVVRDPIGPDEMVEACRTYDVGLAMEPATPFNRTVCLTNKALTYILAGLAVALTDTPGQQVLARDLGPGAHVYPSGDIAALARGLSAWASDRSQLRRARVAAWSAATTRWHWEHRLERGAMLSAIASFFSGQSPCL